MYRTDLLKWFVTIVIFRLDRLFALLENCRNASLRAAAAQQLGELVQNLPSNLENVFNRLIPLLRSRSWVSRLSAADVIRSIVRNLPSWDPLSPVDLDEPECATTAVDKDGFLSLRDLRLDRVLAQGARLYSMDARELERPNTRPRSGSQSTPSANSSTNPASDSVTFLPDALSDNNSASSTFLVQRHELNSRLGLEDDNVITKVLAQHSDVSASNWVSPEDLVDETTGSNDLTPKQDVANSSPIELSKRSRLDHQDENCCPLSTASPRTVKRGSSASKGWPLDHFCTLLLGDLWALRWETRHGAASGLRELLAENRHTKHCGKRTDMSETEMEISHSRYLEDIVVRVLCTLALDQLSDFISDEVVSPVRETAAQLLGVLSLHLSTEQVMLIAKHLVYLVTLETRTPEQNSTLTPESSWKNSWMIVHGGLLGIKYLLASRRDLRPILLTLITPCLIEQLNAEPVKLDSNTGNCIVSGADEDIRAAAASALLPIVDSHWCSTTFGSEQTRHLLGRIWSLLGALTSDLAPSTGPLLQLVSALIKASPDVLHKSGAATDWFSTEIQTVTRLLHHVSCGIRQHALATLECFLDALDSQKLELTPPLLLLVVDQLFHRILLESTDQVRSKATKLCITVIRRADLSFLAQACVERLDFWLCQAMQPIGVPYPPHLFGAKLIVPHTDQTFSCNLNEQQSNVDVGTKNVDTSGQNNCSSEPDYLHCIGGSQVINNDVAETEAFVWDTRVCALRVLSRLFGRLCQYTYPTDLSTGEERKEEQPSIICYFLDHLLCRLHLTERLAMQRSIAGLILSTWALLPCRDDQYKSDYKFTWGKQVRYEERPATQVKELPEYALSAVLQRELEMLVPKLRAKMESCLTEVVVEFGIAAAFVNFEWLLPGRLTLLIRPLMDTIRCVRPVSGISDSTSGRAVNSPPQRFSPTGSHVAFQRLASACLTKLLLLEWKANCSKVNQGDKAQRVPNPSRAATKVVKNLASSLLEADSQLSAMKINTDLVPNQLETTACDLQSSDCQTNVLLDMRRSSADTMPGQSPSELSSQLSSLEYRQRGTSIALTCLCRTFLRSLENPTDSLYELQLGLPVLWNTLWAEPLQRIEHLVDRSVDECTLKQLITAKLWESLKQPITQTDEEVICTGLISLCVCVPALLPCLAESAQLSFEMLVYFGAMTSCLPRSKIQMLGARLLAALALLRTVPLFNLLIPVVLPLLEPEVGENGVRLTDVCKTTLNSLTGTVVIIEHLTNVTPHSSVSLLSVDNTDPLASAERNSISDDRSSFEPTPSNGCSSSHLPEALRSFLPYMVLFVPPVLRLLADQDERIRESAGHLFTVLLNLFPLESSLPDAIGMDRKLSDARVKERCFIDSLLHPEHIQFYNLPVTLKTSLRPYQQDGINWLNFLNRYGLNGILCDDLGLGKTLQTICILAGSHYELHQRLRSTSAGQSEFKSPVSLVVCPSTLCGHWLHEVEQFIDNDSLVPIIYSGGPSARQKSIFWNYVVLDEGHIIKSSKSKVTRALKKLRAQHRLILTGTPIQNRVCELWSLFDFLMPDFLGSESSFSSRFARPVAASRDPKASKADQRAGHLALEKLHRLVLPFMLRRLKEDVMADLPPKIIQDFACEMTSVQWQLYEAFTKSTEGQRLIRSVGNVIQSETDRPATVTTGDSRYGFQALRYLQAICNHPCLALKRGHPALSEVERTIQIEFGSNIALNSVQLSGKLLGLCRLLTDCGFGTPNFTTNWQSSSVSQHSTMQSELDDDRTLLSQHRALVFFQTREMLQLTEDMLRMHFPWITSTRLDGQVPVSERQNRMIKKFSLCSLIRAVSFNQDPSIDIMLLTTAVGGLGLNLTGADTVIFVEHDWNPSKDLQAMDRAHRIGQKRTVSVYRLITQDSIEEQIMNLQAFKLHLANTVVTTENRSLTGMDTEHLFDRFADTPHSRTDNSVGANTESLDSVERCYELEYNLDAFVSRLKNLD
ncbi:protein, SNF2 family [Opisthorchis viverrini]|uniref:Protein, SNF2 family n=1 Tax=Opisthorchis viverrini TaxID=6198 RepID=A0A1S8WJ37_OPIVI|nr:protein, SNF2 family [Opisthorchis viverrini]